MEENKPNRVSYSIDESLLTELLPRIIKQCVKAAIWGAVETLSTMAIFVIIIWKTFNFFTE